MSKISDRVSYLQGLAEGMKLNTEKDSNRLLLGVLDVLADISEAMDELEASHEELSEYVDSIDEDLADLEAELYDDEDDEYYGDEEDSEEDDEDDEDDDDEVSEDDILLYECPHCGTEVQIEANDLEIDENAKCPQCGKELFPELPEE